jgi:hypothetical protein
MRNFELNGKTYTAKSELVNALKSVRKVNAKDNSAFLGLFDLGVMAGMIKEVA